MDAILSRTMGIGQVQSVYLAFNWDLPRQGVGLGLHLPTFVDFPGINSKHRVDELELQARPGE